MKINDYFRSKKIIFETRTVHKQIHKKSKKTDKINDVKIDICLIDHMILALEPNFFEIENLLCFEDFRNIEESTHCKHEFG